MFPSSSGFSPFFQPSFTACTSQNPISPLQKQQADYSSPFLHFPRAFLDENYDFLENEHFPSQQQNQQEVFGTNLSADSPQAQEITPVDSLPCVTRRTRSVKNKNKKVSSMVEKQHTSQRRTRKKDRHSKIYTAQGFRDRRMRLSLQIARDFFDLQDMLKFDKASKTIEWLINKSKVAIKDLKDSISKKSKQYSSGDGEAAGGKSVSSTSESEVVSEIELQPQYEPFFSSPAVKKSRKLKKALVYNPLARCSREKARERARERTREKLKTRNPSLEQLVVCGSQEINCAARGTVNGEDQGKEPSTYMLQRGMDSLGITDRFVGIGDGQNFCVSNGANFEDEYSGFPGTWEMNNGRAQYMLCGMPHIMSSSTGIVHEQNPNEIFLTNPPNHHHQQQNLSSSAFMSTLNYQQGNPNAVFMDISKTNTSHQENPTSITMNAARNNDFHSHHFVGNQLTSTTTTTSTTDDVVNRYGRLY